VSDNSLNFNEGNVIKYITRARKKGTHLIDLEKALDYIQREIKIVRENELKQIEQ
jgi:ribosomal protein S2